MKLTKTQHQDFVYWATQYIKRKCIGAKIKIFDGDPMAMNWLFKGTERNTGWDHDEISTAMNVGPDAIRSLIRNRIKEVCPEIEQAASTAP